LRISPATYLICASYRPYTTSDRVPRPLILAYAIRRFQGEQLAASVLEHAKTKFPTEALIPYNLTCYRAVRGRVAEAKQLLAEAFTLDASLRTTSLDDPDLVGVWDSYQS